MDAYAVCPCQTDVEEPGPHIASCPWSDPSYEPTGEPLVDMAEQALMVTNVVVANEPREPLVAMAKETLENFYCQAKTRDDGQCEEPAIYGFSWPGQKDARQCERHTRWAVHVADVMGFKLVVWRLQ